MLVCFFYNVVGNTVLFLGQTPIMDHAPWFWIWMALGVVNLWGGVGSAYLADIMPPEWRSIAFVSPAAICKGPSHLTTRGRLTQTVAANSDTQLTTSDWEATPRRTVLCFWLWLSDATPARAAMRYVPGSHVRTASPIRSSTDMSVRQRFLKMSVITWAAVSVNRAGFVLTSIS